MTVKEAALEYLTKYKFSLFPMRVIRKPWIAWMPYQIRLPDVAEVDAWFSQYTDANVALVTGRVSGITVLDVDAREGYDIVVSKLGDIHPPTVRSPSGGWHMYFKYNPKIPNNELIPGVEGKNDRSNITAPPSVGVNGVPYTWDLPLDVGLPEMPIELEDVLAPAKSLKTIKDGGGRNVVFRPGKRNESLFHTALVLAKQGMLQPDIEEIIRRLNSTCDPPLTEDEIMASVKSAVETSSRKGRNLAHELKEWVDLTDGWFTIQDICKSIGSLSEKEKANLHVILHRMTFDGIIERHDKTFGRYRRPQTDVEPLEWAKEVAEPLDVELPLDIGDLGIKIFPGNIIVLAGDNNSGKTAFLLNTVKMNMNKPMAIHYFSNDMMAAEMHRRLLAFKDVPESAWNFKAWSKSTDFADVIQPDSINIVDFLQEHDEFWLIGKHIQDMWKRLRGGIAIVAIQKKYESDVGMGGTFGLHKARLYLSMRRGRIKVLKAKLWDGSVDPNFMSRKFHLEDGGNMTPIGPWYYEVEFKKNKEAQHGA